MSPERKIASPESQETSLARELSWFRKDLTRKLAIPLVILGAQVIEQQSTYRVEEPSGGNGIERRFENQDDEVKEVVVQVLEALTRGDVEFLTSRTSQGPRQEGLGLYWVRMNTLPEDQFYFESAEEINRAWTEAISGQKLSCLSYLDYPERPGAAVFIAVSGFKSIVNYPAGLSPSGVVEVEVERRPEGWKIFGVIEFSQKDYQEHWKSVFAYWEPCPEIEKEIVVDQSEALDVLFISGFSDNSESKRFDPLIDAINQRVNKINEGREEKIQVNSYYLSPNGWEFDPETGESKPKPYSCEDSKQSVEEVQGLQHLTAIVEHQKWHPNHRIGLVGWSNGGPVVLWVEKKLMENNMVIDGVKVNLDFGMSVNSPHEGVARPLVFNFLSLIKRAPFNFPCGSILGADSPAAQEIISRAGRRIIMEGRNQRLVDKAKVDYHIQTYNVLNWEDCLYDALWCTTLTGANRINEHLLELLWRSRYSLSQRILGADWKDFDLPARWGDWGHGIALTDPASIDWMVGRILRHVPRGFIALAWFLAKYG